MLENISLSKKLWGSSLSITLLIVAAAYAMHAQSVSALQTALDDIANRDANIVEAMRWKGLIDANVQRVIANGLSTGPEIPALFAERIKQGVEEITALQKQVVEHASAEPEKAALSAVAERRRAVLEYVKKVAEMKKNGDTAGMGQMVTQEMMPVVGAYFDSLNEFIKVQQRLRDEAKAAADQGVRRKSMLGAAVMAAVILASGWFMRWLSNSIAEPLKRVVEAAEQIAAGDLTHSHPTARRDELGQMMRAIDDMAARLRRLVTEVRSGVESVSTASAEIATGNQDLSVRTEQTASNLQETANAMEQVNGTVSNAADTARQANQLAHTAAQAATRGGTVVNGVIENMQQISESSRRIGDIIGVIDGIAFQTNILALNAAVEAARAGESGRGFAVVAAEVRSLAQRSAEAAREIKSLIGASTQTVESGAGLVAQTGEVMSEIVVNVRKVADMIGEIAASSTEQRDGISHINGSISQLDQMTQQNAALVEQSAAAAQSLRDQAQRLAGVVAAFRVA